MIAIYAMVLIPVSYEKPSIILAGVACALLLAGPFIIMHEVVFMKRRWDKAAKFLDEGEEGGVPAKEAMVAMMDFPIKMPLLGFCIWMLGGVGMVIGVEIATDFMTRAIDLTFMFAALISGTAIITIFQIYYWRQVVDPVMGAIIHKAPDVLDENLNAERTSIRRLLSWTLIPLIFFFVVIGEMAGYRQAATAVQNEVGRRNLLQLSQNWEYKLRDINDLDELLNTLRTPERDPLIEPHITFLVKKEVNEEGKKVYTELVGEKTGGEWKSRPFEEIIPQIGIELIFDKLDEADANGEAGDYEYDLFNARIAVGKKIKVAGDDYYLSYEYPWENYSKQLDTYTIIALVLLLVVLVISILVVSVISKDMATPISKLVEFSEAVGSGNIHSDVFYYANDEVGDLALSMRKMGGQLGEMILRIKTASQSMDEATDSIHKASDQVKAGADQTEEAIEDVASAIAEMDMSTQGISDNVEVLSASAEESSSSIFEMGAAVKKINESVDILDDSINEVSSSINEMTVALDQVADNVSNLSAVSEETASSMAEMDASIREVETSTKDTAEWSQSVIKDAEEGVTAVNRVTSGMREISEVVHSAQLVIESLGGRVSEIGKIVKVIDDVANQTNLLALNAAIIAAQAGEYGKGFAVVADEIKELAERTSGSTREIHLLIRGVQEESIQAVGAVEAGARAVEEGENLADQASSSLAQIMSSTSQVIERIQKITRTTIEQSESSRQVSQAIDKVADMVSQMSVATSEQSRGGALILNATEEMKTAAIQVKRNAEEQLQGSRLITKSIENITDMLYSINMSQQEHKKSSTQIVQLMERIKVVSQENTDSVSALTQVVEILASESDVLRDEMKNFETDLRSNNGKGKTGV